MKTKRVWSGWSVKRWVLGPNVYSLRPVRGGTTCVFSFRWIRAQENARSPNVDRWAEGTISNVVSDESATFNISFQQCTTIDDMIRGWLVRCYFRVTVESSGTVTWRYLSTARQPERRCLLICIHSLWDSRAMWTVGRRTNDAKRYIISMICG